MLKGEHQAYILHRTNLYNRVLSSSLSPEINVSENTIRRDITELSESGRVIKVHGGALPFSFNRVYYSPAATYSQINKKTIVQKKVTLKCIDILISELPANNPVFEPYKNLELLFCKR
jgi:DeoR/GlpR family transcriptional regulator of sugar metabolism